MKQKGTAMQTMTATFPTTADIFSGETITLTINRRADPLGEITLRRIEALAHLTIEGTEPDPWRTMQVADTLQPNEDAQLGRCESLANRYATLPEQMAYPLRDTVWHAKLPLHAEKLAGPWFTMLTAMADAADEIKRETGHDMSADVQRAGNAFTRACAVPPGKEAELAQMGYTACELAITTLLQTCKSLGEAITKHRLGDGLKLCRASEAAYKIVESAIRTRTKGLHLTTH